jgi:hypothetical protein
MQSIRTILCRLLSGGRAVNRMTLGRRQVDIGTALTRAAYNFGPISGGVVLVGN